jgi:replicative DNA helicase
VEFEHDQINKFAEYARRKREKPKILKCGFNTIDRHVVYGGLPQDFLIYIQAKASVGKTYFVTNWITRILKSNNTSKILFFSREMDYEHITDRILQSFFASSIVSVGNMVRDSNDKVSRELNKVRYYDRLTIHDGALDMKIFESMVDSEKPSIVFVDHLHKIGCEGSEDIFNKTTKLSNFLFEIKKKYQTRIVSLVQIKRLNSDSRGVNTGEDFSMLSDGKGSGAIEEDGDLILSLRRPDVNPDCEVAKRRTVQALIIKNRYSSGDTSVMIWRYDPETSVLTEVP